MYGIVPPLFGSYAVAAVPAGIALRNIGRPETIEPGVYSTGEIGVANIAPIVVAAPLASTLGTKSTAGATLVTGVGAGSAAKTGHTVSSSMAGAGPGSTAGVSARPRRLGSTNCQMAITAAIVQIMPVTMTNRSTLTEDM
jgi:hypothetical protein